MLCNNLLLKHIEFLNLIKCAMIVNENDFEVLLRYCIIKLFGKV